MPTEAKETFKISKRRVGPQKSGFWFLIRGPVFLEENRNLKLSPLPVGRRQYLLCISQPSSLTPHSVISWEVSPKGHSHFSHTSPCYYVSHSWLVVNTLYCIAGFVLKEDKEVSPCSFLLTSSFPVLVKSQQHILSLSVKSHLCSTTVMNARMRTCGFRAALS